MPNLAELVAKLVDAFDRLQLRYALGGALATSFWGTPRATEDVDCLIAIPAIKYQLLVDELQGMGCLTHDGSLFTVPVLLEQVKKNSFVECYHGSIRIELFVPIVALQQEVLRRAIAMPFGGRQVFVTTAEDLILLKLAFHRPKDLQDVRGIAWVQRGRLDLEYLRDWSARTHEPMVQQELNQLITECSQQDSDTPQA